MKLYYADPARGATGYGWATCNAGLQQALARRCELGPPGSEVVLMPLADHAFNPISPTRGKVNLAYTFFESPLEPAAAEHARRYDTVFVGSTWCQQRCTEAGITNTRVLIQGVDPQVFPVRPARSPDGTIRVFSGGKFEFRKGQDLVIAAFREFLRGHPHAHLVCAWHNPWPQLIGGMAASPVLRWSLPGPPAAEQADIMRHLLAANGVPAANCTVLPGLPPARLAEAMAATDFGLFPNRCEGGTNLVLMEYLASGRTAVANLATGHADLTDAAILPIPATIDDAGWAVQRVEDIVAAMARAAAPEENALPKDPRRHWDWDDAARIVVETARAHLGGGGPSALPQFKPLG